MSTRHKLLIGSLLALCLGTLTHFACTSKNSSGSLFSPRAASLPPTSVQGTITASGGSVIANTAGSGSISVQITGTFSQTLSFQASYDNGVTWQAVSAYPIGSGASVQSTTATGVWLVNVAGALQFQVTCTNFSSGTATVTLSPSPVATTSVAVNSAGTTGGVTPYQLISGASNNATSLKGSGGQVYYITASNFNTSSARYVKFYSKATAPAPASDTPLLTISIPAAVSASQPSVVTISGPAVGINFAAGIGFAIVANLAVNDNTSVGANDVEVNIGYN